MEYSCIIKGPIKDGKGRVLINIEVDSDPEGADKSNVWKCIKPKALISIVTLTSCIEEFGIKVFN